MTDKKFTIKQHLGNKYVFFKTSESPTPITIKEALDATADLLKKNNCNKVLVDARPIKILPSIFDTFTLGEHLADEDTIKSGRMAFVILEKSSHVGKFLSTVASNRGLEVSLFNKITDGKKWLFS